GQNPLYLPQAKVYARCCALGPSVASTNTIEDPHDLEMAMSITRDNTEIYQETTNTDQMVRTCEELVNTLQNHNSLPDITVLLTGTSLVPPDDFTLQPGDIVTIEIENIGTLENPVTEV
ncbi:MAG: fumarylacetoacetate hydrolase family protein, partial [Halobacteriaceae archaeon]